MFSTRPLPLMLAAAVLATALVAVSRRAAHAQPPDSDIPEQYKQSDGAVVQVAIGANQIGILAAPDVTTAEIIMKVASFGLAPASGPQTRILLFSTSGTLSRDSLLRLGRTVLERLPAVVSQAGFVVRKPGEPDPFIATDEFIVRMRADAPAGKLDELNNDASAAIVMANPFSPRQYLLRLRTTSSLDSFRAAKQYVASGFVEYAYPNFINAAQDQQAPRASVFFGSQWPHDNTGQRLGTVDADADTAEAWDITQGDATTVIAIVENGGFELTHPDLAPNLWQNPRETVRNGVDEDSNGLVDDINGWDFSACTTAAGPGCGSGDVSPAAGEDHGTPVAGIAAASGIGVTGACPKCRLMLLKTGSASSDWAKSLAIHYADSKGAQIINNSWTAVAAPNTLTAIDTVAATGRGGLGTLVVFAAGNLPVDRCASGVDPLVSSPNTIAVSGSSNQDRKVILTAVGGCISVLAPTHRGNHTSDPFTGTMNITTTDRIGNQGSNRLHPIPGMPCPIGGDFSNKAYTRCFGGTSASAPLVSGILGLVLTVRPSLTREQVKRLLQDTADKVEPGVGGYADANGRSSPPSGLPSHAFGRVNAFEAVRVVAPAAQGGKDGVDIFLRDNRLDWGNTEQPSNTLFEVVRGFISHSESVDVKVDGPPFQPAPASSVDFESFTHENAQAGVLNKVYVRVRNRGPVPAAAVDVKLHWAFAGSGLPPLPTDFWKLFPADSATTTDWHPLGVQTIKIVPYSGSSVAGAPGDAAQIVSFDFTPPPLDPKKPNPDHFCIFAVIDSPQDRASPKSRPTIMLDFNPDSITPIDNNMTLRNVTVEAP